MKKVISIMLVVALMLAALPMGVFSVFAESEALPYEVWDGEAITTPLGRGTEQEPYLVSNGAELAWMIKNSNHHYVLTNDIYLNDIDKIDWATGEGKDGHTPNSWYNSNHVNNVFSGTIDGDGHVIYGLYHKDTTPLDDYRTVGYGLLPEGGNVTIKNLGIDKSYLEAYTNYSFGVFVGRGQGTLSGVIDSCYSGADVTIKGFDVGTIVGGGDIASNFTINNTYSLAKALGSHLNGMVGDIWTNEYTVESCYAVGIGIFGKRPGYLSVIRNSYSSLEAGDTSGVEILSTDNMQGLDVLQNNNKMPALGDKFLATEEYPVLKVFVKSLDDVITPPTPTYGNGENLNVGTGTETDPYIISTAGQLYRIATMSKVETEGKYFELANDIYLNDVSDLNWYNNSNLRQWVFAVDKGQGFDNSKAFAGHFDGKGYVVRGLYINTKTTHSDPLNADLSVAAGLFPILGGGATITSVGLEDSYISVKNAITGDDPYTEDIDESLCMFSGYVGAVGGIIVDYSDENPVVIDRCYANESDIVKGYWASLGGFAFYSGTGITVKNCYNTMSYELYSYADYKGNRPALIGGHGTNITYIGCWTIHNLYGNRGCANTDSYNNYYTTWVMDTVGATKISVDDMKGSNARIMMPKLDWDNMWVATIRYPVLKIFVDAREQDNEEISIWNGRLSSYLQGKGTQSEPYLIKNGADLAFAVKNGIDGHFYKLTNDIYLNDVSKIDWTSGTVSSGYVANEWFFSDIPDGNSYDVRTVFRGTIDGDGNTIYGLYYTPGNYYTAVGLLPAASDTTVRNLRFKDSFICGGRWTGSVVGYGTKINVNQVVVDSDVTIWGYDVGGHYYEGGLVNWPYSGSASSKITFTSEGLGGIIGYAASSLSLSNVAVYTEVKNSGFNFTIQNPNVAGGNKYKVDTAMHYGGLIGASWNTLINVSDSISIQSTFDGYNDKGAIEYSNVFSSVYTDKVSDTLISKSNIFGKEAKHYLSSFDWNVWTPTLGFPTLKMFYVEPDIDDSVSCVWDGSVAKNLKGGGSATEPYLISNGSELAYVVKHNLSPNNYYALTQNIFLNDLEKIDWLTGDPIGDYVPNSWYDSNDITAPFDGCFNGNGKTVYGMYYKNTTPITDEIKIGGGLFPTYNKAYIYGLGLDKSYYELYTNFSLGGLLGYGHLNGCKSTIEQCHIGSDVSLKGHAVGTIVGGGITELGIFNCISLAKVTADYRCGIVGDFWTEGCSMGGNIGVDITGAATLDISSSYMNYTTVLEYIQNPVMTSVSKDDIKDFYAKATMPTLDWDHIFITVDDNYPDLRIFDRHSTEATPDPDLIPEQIVNVVAVGEVNKITISWGESAEVNTQNYKIYRKAEGEERFTCIKTISGRNILSYEDTNVIKGKAYTYYVTGVGLYNAESHPSLQVSATVLFDDVPPTILKITPSATSIITGKTTISATVTDNAGVTRVDFYYSIDNGETWTLLESVTNSNFSVMFDTTIINNDVVKFKVVAFDAESNESAHVSVVYSLDNTGPEKVTGISATVLSSKITLSWNDVSANDAAYFVLQKKSGENWITVADKITTLGYTISSLNPNTSYSYRVTCVDTFGNIGEYSDEFTVTTEKDATAPVITGQTPNSARFNGNVSMSFTAKDDCDIASIEIQTSSDLNVWTTLYRKNYTSRYYSQTLYYDVNLGVYLEGSIYVRAIATDFSGNISNTGATAPYTEYIVDKTAPEAPKGVSANGNVGYVTVSWNMGQESDISRYSVYRATAVDGNYVCVASNLSSLNYHDRSVQSGIEYYYKVKVSDLCGNISEFSNYVCTTMSPDTQKPEITGIGSTYQQKVSATLNTVNITANDNNKLETLVVEYRTTSDGEYQTLVSSTGINNYYKSLSVSIPVNGLKHEDSIYIRVYAVDMAGLVSEFAYSQYVYDAVAPEVSSFNTTISTDSVTIHWNDCNESDLAGFKVYRSENGVNFALIGSRGKSNTGKYSFVDYISAKENKTFIYKLEAIDRLGNSSECTKNVNYVYEYVNEAPIPVIGCPDFMTVGVEEIFNASSSSDDVKISLYYWDFGDGTYSDEVKPVKSYDTIGKYTISLTVTDSEGVSSTVFKEIEVKNRELLGVLNVKVVDESGHIIPYVPVYFDLGSENQKIIYTSASGIASLNMTSGTHIIGMYASGYLPVKKEVVVVPNMARTISLVTVKEEIVTGKFEVKRMTFEEIVAAGISVYDPANQNVYSATVRVTYGSSAAPITINYVRNDDKIISYTIKDTNGNHITNYVNSNGEKRKITGIAYIPCDNGKSDIVAIIDIPAEASFLKEFFDVKLHIVNNASSDFELIKNEVILNVPSGMTLMNSVTGQYLKTNIAYIDSIKGQETVTLSWVLRGDKAGNYNLSADFTGILAEFNEVVNAHFKTEEPIKVYGLEGVKFRILAADEIHNDTLYFNVELENERDIDIYMPSIGITDKISSLTQNVLGKDDTISADAYLLNAYIQNVNGSKLYIPVTYDANGRAVTNIKVLAPGQKLVYEYVVYNAIHYDGIAYFANAAIVEFDGIYDNIETGSFTRERYNFSDYSQKLDDILNRVEDVEDAYNYILNNGNYYYNFEAQDKENGVLKFLYNLGDVLLNSDISSLTKEEQVNFTKSAILALLSDSSMISMSEDLLMEKYYSIARDMIDVVKLDTIENFADSDKKTKEIADVFEYTVKNAKELSIVLREKGLDEFKKELNKIILKSSLGFLVDANTIIDVSDEAEIVSKHISISKSAFLSLINIAESSERDLYYFSVLKYNCNYELTKMMLDNLVSSSDRIDNEDSYAGIVKDVAEDLLKEMDANIDAHINEVVAINVLYEARDVAFKAATKAILKKFHISTPVAIIKATFNIADVVFGFGNYYKQQDSLCIYNALTNCFVESYRNNLSQRDEVSDFYTMIYLRAVCELRLVGEKQYKDFIMEYYNGKYVDALTEAETVAKINKLFDTNYESLDEWYETVQYNIVHSRDVLFNIAKALPPEIPAAPVVTLDYKNLQTYQSFTSEYEYCFADGIWRLCNGEPIKFAVGDVPSVLRVRKAASDNNLVGEITTVTILSKEELENSDPDNSKPAVNLSFSGASLTLYNNLAINYKVNETLFTEVGYTNPYVIFKYDGAEKKVTDYYIKDGKYIFDFTGIAPNQLGEVITSTLYATYNGKLYSSADREYSVKEYCYNMLSKYSNDTYAAYRTLLVDLLNYGAQSQIYTKYNMGSLVNAELTATQKGYATSKTPTYKNVFDIKYKTVTNPTVTWKGCGLNLQSAVTLRFKIGAESLNGLTIRVTSDSGQSWTLRSKSFEKTDGGYYVYFNGLSADKMSETIYLTAYVNGKAVSNTVRYSIESYVYSKQNSTDIALQTLLEFMMKYGNSASKFS